MSEEEADASLYDMPVRAFRPRRSKPPDRSKDHELPPWERTRFSYHAKRSVADRWPAASHLLPAALDFVRKPQVLARERAARPLDAHVIPDRHQSPDCQVQMLHQAWARCHRRGLRQEPEHQGPWRACRKANADGAKHCSSGWSSDGAVGLVRIKRIRKHRLSCFSTSGRCPCTTWISALIPVPWRTCRTNNRLHGLRWAGITIEALSCARYSTAYPYPPY